MRLGEFLISEKLVSEQDVFIALEVQQIAKRKLGRVLLDLGAISSECLDQGLQKYFQIPKCSNLAALMQTGRPLQIHVEETSNIGYLVSNTLLVENYSDALIEIAEKVKSQIGVQLVDPEQARVLMGASSIKAEPMVDAQKADENSHSIGAKTTTPFNSMLESLLSDAKKQGASDIHFDGTKDGIRIRFRVLGDLIDVKRIRSELSQSFLAEVKHQTGLPLTVVGSPSSGAARFKPMGLKVRSQSNGQIFGESVVLRLIDEEKVKGANIRGIGADEIFIRELESAMSASNGLILMCGQTGSGKSWTLYSALMSLDRDTMKVITIEDPVEYEGEGLMQIDVSDGRFGFKDALRSSLRLDPDVVMVGEIRDEETAELAMKAASTGHLVFSTLHTNGAAEAITRLKGLGIAEDVLADNLRLVSALTLRKRLCEKCSIKVSQDEFEMLGDDLASLAALGATFYRRNLDGCAETECVRGATGRVLLTESAGREVVTGLLNGYFVPGFRDLRQVGVEFAAQGIIGVEDAIGN